MNINKNIYVKNSHSVTIDRLYYSIPNNRSSFNRMITRLQSKIFKILPTWIQ